MSNTNNFGLWEKQAKTGNIYYSGKVSISNRVYWCNLFPSKSTKENAPAYSLLFSEDGSDYKSAFIGLWLKEAGDTLSYKGHGEVGSEEYAFTITLNNSEHPNAPSYRLLYHLKEVNPQTAPTNMYAVDPGKIPF
jgi:hypothetical protein